jgi:hypothetical protein
MGRAAAAAGFGSCQGCSSLLLCVPALGFTRSPVQLILCSVTVKEKLREREAGDLFQLPRFLKLVCLFSVMVWRYLVQGHFF